MIQKKVGKISASQAWDDEYQIQLRENANGFVELDTVRQLQRLAKPAHPPSNNMGGTYPLPPPFFSHCEKSGLSVAQKAKIDWLGFTSHADVESLKLLLDTIWPGVVFSRNAKGMPGYPESCSITLEGVQFGQMGYGAKHGKNHVSLPGTACKTLTPELIEVFHEALSMPEYAATLNRIDLCFDLYRGELSWDHAKWAYENGAFKRPRAARSPQVRFDGIVKDGANMGRTMTVGKRGGFVIARVYEKGLEVFAKLPEELQLLSECRHADLEAAQVDQADSVPKFQADTWVRLEAEYRRQDEELMLPLEMMLRRDQYFAGSFPYFGEAIGRADGIRPPILKTEFEVDLLAMIANGKRSYGSLIHSLKSLGFSDADVVEHLSTGRHNDKLVRSGLFSEIRSAVDLFQQMNPDHDIPF
jgi:DNA relaxase NicK